MSSAKRQKRFRRSEEIEVKEDEEIMDAVLIPNPDDSGESDIESDFEECLNDESSELEETARSSFHQTMKNYSDNQSKLEPNHNFQWSSELKSYIIEATRQNGYNLSKDDFDAFVGIIILSSLNQRKSQRDYWCTDELLACKPIVSAMSRTKFEDVKSKIKMSKSEDENSEDKAWRVRVPLEIFRKNLKQFGFFLTCLSVDEMMLKFYGRTVMKQFIKGKPIRFGIKMWAICSVEGFLFDCDIYCGKGSNFYSFDLADKLSKCPLGSRVVMQMTQSLLTSVVPKKLSQYHLYFDNYFSSPDLMVHLKNNGLRATGTVRQNRLKVKNNVPANSKRGTFEVQHDKTSADYYLKKSGTASLKTHKLQTVASKKNCHYNAKCNKRTQKMCIQCGTYQCITCFQSNHM
ncbi:piggyBac transposable element-derived protein 3-like [Leptopilina heterotoma]|uniref:piggyBac transposable element-derived protein 3-like n=1 Tax=Leptopilina heterotoma TaxID=63436 RepID=UPI001CA83212|nr:piggyBac transposable element-derived protein 3-like [Leptopilina heterotoma]